MSRWISGLTAAAVLGLLAPLQGIADRHAAGEADRAKTEQRVLKAAAQVGGEYYQQYCAVCHGEDAKGGGEYAGLLAVKPPDLTRIAARGGGVFSESSTARLIDGRFDLPAHGSREMPVWGMRLADQIPGMATGDEVVRGRVTSLVEYLRSLQVE